MAKSATVQAVPTKVDDFSIFTACSDVRDVICIGTRSMRNQALKCERIVDITTDAILHSAEFIDHTTRANLATVQADKPL